MLVIFSSAGIASRTVQPCPARLAEMREKHDANENGNIIVTEWAHAMEVDSVSGQTDARTNALRVKIPARDFREHSHCVFEMSIDRSGAISQAELSPELSGHIRWMRNSLSQVTIIHTRCL